jgi:ABC-type bacteriocin/lantibiotic exporter with double-glycine peptidase domain
VEKYGREFIDLFYDEGTISIDGTDIKDINLQSLRGLMGGHKIVYCLMTAKKRTFH